MLPQMRQIQRLVVDEQSTHAEREGVELEAFAKGMGRARLADEVGWDDMRV